MAADEIVRDAAGADSLSAFDNGVFDRAELVPFAPALRKGEAVLLMTGGVCVLDGGLLGLLMDGLSQEEKKSFPGSPEGVEDPSRKVGDKISVMETSLGNLSCREQRTKAKDSTAYSRASVAARRFSSSLYLEAVFEVYRTLASLLARAAEPPCD